MAVRPIDGNALIEWFRPYLHTDEAITPDVVIEDIRSMPTITPPNELERMKKIMRYNGIMVIPSKYPGGRPEWNIPKPCGQKEKDI